MGSLKRGALIVIEGVDRSGKSTQCKKLMESLTERHIKSKLLNFPDRTTLTGKLIDEYLRNKDCNLNDQTIHLLFSANRWENIEKMEKMLYDGITLIVDRYSYSGIVFSAVKKNMELAWCKHPEVGLPKPDLVFLLTLNEEQISKRPNFGNERYENIDVQKNVAQMYEQLSVEDPNWINIDAGDSIEKVHSKLLEQCLQKITEVELKPLELLKFN